MVGRLSFIFRTDTHVADKSPASWKADYPAEIWSNLVQIGALAHKYEANAVLDGGDFFHVKASSRNPHSLIIKTAEIHAAYPCPTFCVEGNHDIQYNNLETLNRQPLGVLYATGVFKHLREQVFKDGDLQVRVVGVPYNPHLTTAELRTIKKKPGDNYLVAVVHALAGENPPPEVEDFFNEPVFRYGDLVQNDGPDIWMFGHWHRDQGIVRIGDVSFVNHGAVSRGSLIRENLERTPKVAWLEADQRGIRVTSIPLVVAPPEDVFDLERKAKQEEERYNIDQFVERLAADIDFDPERSIVDNIKGLGFANDVRDLALRYLSDAGEGMEDVG
jgi:DNA repair exonuclease SbcCD nuclease subunit